jgi:hypothetical protein
MTTGGDGTTGNGVRQRAADDAIWPRRRRDHRPLRAFLRTTNLYSPSLLLSISSARLLEDCEHGLVLANLQILAPSFCHCCSPQGWRRCCPASAPLPRSCRCFQINLTSSDSFFLFFLDVCSIHSWPSFSSSPGIELLLLNVSHLRPCRFGRLLLLEIFGVGRCIPNGLFQPDLRS